jgi:hypothetical protein
MVDAAKASLLTQRRIDLSTSPGPITTWNRPPVKNEPLDQVDLVERSAVDPARVLQGQAQTGHAMGGLLEVVAPPRLCSNSLAIVE